MKISTKKLYAFNFIAVAVCVIGTVILLPFTPDTIPAHYNLAGEIDRFGSKYENLIFPALAAAIWIFFLLYAKKQGKVRGVEYEKTVLLASAVTLGFLDAISFYCMIEAMQYDSSAPRANGMGGLKFAGIAVGVLLIVLGNIMPKVRRNSVFGVRTKWSRANDRVWQQSQRFGGRTAILCGFAMMIGGVVIPENGCVLFMAVLLIVWSAASVLASYLYYRKR